MEIHRFGIQDGNQISSYILKTTRNEDKITIKLKDKKFGFLNKTKKATFKRFERALTVNNEIVMYNEISPILLKLLDNLDSFKVKHKSKFF
jgi:hypothetical protein